MSEKKSVANCSVHQFELRIQEDDEYEAIITLKNCTKHLIQDVDRNPLHAASEAA